jgi:hypothetical protein
MQTHLTDCILELYNHIVEMICHFQIRIPKPSHTKCFLSPLAAVTSSSWLGLFGSLSFFFFFFFGSVTMIIKSSIFSGLSVDYTQISFPSNQQTHRYLDELLKSPVDGRTEIRDTLVKLNSGHGTLADAFRSEFKFL